jgi:hypothetical protein
MLAAKPWLKGTAPVINTPTGNPPKQTSGLTLEQVKTDEQLMRSTHAGPRLHLCSKAAGKTGI